jgi:hypothetical protein
MAEDSKVTADSSADVKSPAETSTYEELAAAFGDEDIEKPPVETKTEPAKTDEGTPPVEVDENHPTKLGRKVKDLSEKFETFMSKFDEFVTSQKPGQATTEVAERHPDDEYEQMCAVEPPPVETIVTAKDLIDTQNWERRTKAVILARKRVKYEKGYIDTAKALESEGGELHGQILAMITDPKNDTPYNKVVKGIPDVDAELNYRKAMAALVTGKSVKETFGKGEKPQGTGVTLPDNKEKLSTAKEVEISPEVADYIKHSGLTREEVQKALSR